MKLNIGVTEDSVTYYVELNGQHYEKVCKRTEYGCIAERPFPDMFRMAYENVDDTCDTMLAHDLMDLMKEQ